MLNTAKIVENTNYDRKVRQNQVNEFRNILEEDKVESQIAEQLATDLEQAAYNLSGGENTREYRTRMNTVKMRLKGIKGQWIRVILLDKIMTPQELMQMDMQKFNEETVQAFLIQNNRTLPQKQSIVKKQQPLAPPPLIVKQSESLNMEMSTSNKKSDQVIAAQKNQPIVKEDMFQNSNEIDKLDFTPQDEPTQQFEDLGDYSFEYNQKQSGFIEGNDIEELQLNQNQEEEQIVTYQIGSPLPSDNALNQEFMQDELQDEIKQTNPNRILDSQIQLEEQFYYDHQCSFQVKNDNTDQFNDNNTNNQVLSTFGQEENDENLEQNIEKDPCVHTHNLQHTIQQKIINEDLIQTIKSKFVPLTKDNIQEALRLQDQQIEEKLKQLTQAQIDLQRTFIRMQEEHNNELQIYQQESIRNENKIQYLRNENQLIKETLLVQEQLNNFQINALKDQEQQERKQFHKILENQKNQIQNERDYYEQIQFNSNLRREQLFQFQETAEESNLDDQLNMVQEIAMKIQSKRFQSNQQQQQQISSSQEQVQIPNQLQQQSPNQYWASEDDGIIQGTLLNADSGSTQIRRTDQFNQQDVLEEQDHHHQQTEELQPQQQPNYKSNEQNHELIASQNQQGDQEQNTDYASQIKNESIQSNNHCSDNYWEQQFYQVNNTAPTQQQKQKKSNQRQRHDNVPQSLFD